ncbi:unnamed protein product [Leptosia nina]|uniref:Uncharacterized protein n=1 Tax=Leptosia nina TaxID=320188 RepID=A0AAV1JNI1_9NEOP
MSDRRAPHVERPRLTGALVCGSRRTRSRGARSAVVFELIRLMADRPLEIGYLGKVLLRRETKRRRKSNRPLERRPSKNAGPVRARVAICLSCTRC